MLNIRYLKHESDLRGITVTELVVAAGLLVVVMSVVTSLAVRNGRLQHDSRHYRLAVDELTNQLERLTALDADRLADAIAELAPSAQIQGTLPNPELTSERISDEFGDRLVLHLVWDRLGKRRPVTLVGWIDAQPTASIAAGAEEQP
ncbi:MAG: hypothetical protein ACR2NM_04555 [Bythopirellula sp.]